MRRLTFLQCLGVGSCGLAAPISPVLAALPYQFDGQYVYPGVGFLRSCRFPASIDYRAARLDYVTFSRSSVAALIAQGTQLQRHGLQLWQLADANNAFAAINGGYFNMDTFSYDGLLVIDGKQITPQVARYSGVVAVDQSGILSLRRVQDAGGAWSAMQTGPFLIDPGGTMGIHTRLATSYFRSFIAMRSDTIVAGFTSRIDLYELAALLMQNPQAFGVDRFDAALSLSGDASAAFFAREGNETLREGGALPSPAVLLFTSRIA